MSTRDSVSCCRRHRAERSQEECSPDPLAMLCSLVGLAPAHHIYSQSSSSGPSAFLNKADGILSAGKRSENSMGPNSPCSFMMF